ncbi:MAG: LysR family transcriptional regulator [Gemmatimonadetes bacterium]|nr:LysR family transcriptional regulator [Gemmatimonadota bacterium]NIQ60320.1 LysR family transcriptional regulator [Gemmatimonadota bacterium]NIU80538.1 LysR family transcriptional regulator [Gammaproteobacteria bacterium]NIX48860.1 LysR family transcriptional regulator [Gemmatimonadota bacterium]NIY13308.1 LysR family transcriptional regulator [Gemmatimonadota bacterium]
MFVAVVEENGFRAAGRRLGVSGSAVSQTIGQLEERLGVALFERTTRTVRVTDAGERLYESVRPALEELRAAEAEVKELGEEPSGTLRLNVSSGAESVLRGPLLAGFLTEYPNIRLELVVTEHTGEIVAAGYDAAVGLGEVIAQDMIALPVSEELRLAVVGAPSYLEEHGAPEHPRDLTKHVCINWAPSAEDVGYRWEFTEDGNDFTVSVDARVVTTDPELNLRLAVAGVGLTILYDRSVRDQIEAGELVPVLEEYCEPFPGFYLYFPRRRNRPAALRALIDYVRREIRG